MPLRCPRAGLYVLLLMGIPLLCGCTSGVKLPARSPVAGTVTLHGKTAAGVNVHFIPLDEVEGRSASGQTDTQGKYVLQTFESRDGAMPGDYKVIVTHPTSDAQALKEKEMPGGRTAPEGEKIPDKYSNPKTTELKATVKSAANDIPLNLK